MGTSVAGLCKGWMPLLFVVSSTKPWGSHDSPLTENERNEGTSSEERALSKIINVVTDILLVVRVPEERGKRRKDDERGGRKEEVQRREKENGIKGGRHRARMMRQRDRMASPLSSFSRLSAFGARKCNSKEARVEGWLTSPGRYFLVCLTVQFPERIHMSWHGKLSRA